MTTVQWTGTGFADGAAVTTANSGGAAGDALTVTLIGSGTAAASATNPTFTGHRWLRLTNPGGGGTDRARAWHSLTGFDFSQRFYFRVPTDPAATVVLWTLLDNSGSFSIALQLVLTSTGGVRRLRLLDAAGGTLVDWGTITYGTGASNKYMLDVAAVGGTSTTTGQYEVHLYDSAGSEIAATSGSLTSSTANLKTTGFTRSSWGGSAGNALTLDVGTMKANNDSPAALIGPGAANSAPTAAMMGRPNPQGAGTVSGTCTFTDSDGTIASTSITILPTPADGGFPPDNPTVTKSDSGLGTGSVTTSWSFPAVPGRYTVRGTCTDNAGATSNSSDVIIDVYPGSGVTGVLPYRVLSQGSYTVTGASTAVQALADGSNSSYAESPSAPANADMVVEMCAFPPGDIQVDLVTGQDTSSPSTTSRTTWFKEDGTTQIFDETAWANPATGTGTHTVAFDSTALAAVPSVVDRRALRCRIRTNQ